MVSVAAGSWPLAIRQRGETGQSNFNDRGMSGNGGSVYAGGLFINAGTINLQSLTIAFNEGGVWQVGGSVSATDAIFDNYDYSNSASGSRADYQLTGSGHGFAEYCLFQTRYTDIALDSTDITDQPADLGPLGNYGGPVKTIPLLPYSPAIGAGTAISGITTDQRGFAPDSPTPAIGAFQTNPLVVNTSLDGTAPPSAT